MIHQQPRHIAMGRGEFYLQFSTTVVSFLQFFFKKEENYLQYSPEGCEAHTFRHLHFTFRMSDFRIKSDFFTLFLRSPKTRFLYFFGNPEMPDFGAKIGEVMGKNL